MQQIRNYGDERQVATCAYCGGDTLTRDHVPSRVLLDEPYPDNLPVVPACQHCNERFSPDEEYVACLIECVLAGSTSPEEMSRAKIQRILSEKPSLAARLSSARKINGDLTYFTIESDRIKKVVTKLAKGHAVFELNEPQYEEPISVQYIPLITLPDDTRSQFETIESLPIWLEVGSRAMQRLVVASPEYTYSWIIVQPGRYRYAAFLAEDEVIIRMVLSEYLACEVVWI